MPWPCASLKPAESRIASIARWSFAPSPISTTPSSHHHAAARSREALSVAGVWLAMRSRMASRSSSTRRRFSRLSRRDRFTGINGSPSRPPRRGERRYGGLETGARFRHNGAGRSNYGSNHTPDKPDRSHPPPDARSARGTAARPRARLAVFRAGGRDLRRLYRSGEFRHQHPGGARYGYQLLWVVLFANLIAM